jgi:hypothetical protein
MPLINVISLLMNSFLTIECMPLPSVILLLLIASLRNYVTYRVSFILKGEQNREGKHNRQKVEGCKN